MKKVAFILAALALAGCHSTARDSSPSLLKDGVQLQQNKVVADAEHAKVIMRATGLLTPCSSPCAVAAMPISGRRSSARWWILAGARCLAGSPR